MTRALIDRSLLMQAFTLIGTRAYTEGKTIEIAVYGGSALMLTFDWRLATRDVDSVFEADKATVRRLAATVAEELDIQPNWLNDGVKGFLSAHDDDPSSKRLFGTYPSDHEPGLRVMVASPEYLFAMKCRAMRVGGTEENSDLNDIAKLAGELNIETVEQAFEILTAFYPAQMIEPKTQFGLLEILERIQAPQPPQSNRPT